MRIKNGIFTVIFAGIQNRPNTENEDHPSITAWWGKLRHELAESAVTSQTVSAAVCCRSVVLEKQLTAKKLEVGSMGGGSVC